MLSIILTFGSSWLQEDGASLIWQLNAVKHIKKINLHETTKK